MGTIREVTDDKWNGGVKEESTHRMPQKTSQVTEKPTRRSADLSRFERFNSSNGNNEDLVLSVLDGHKTEKLIPDMELEELLMIDRSTRTREMQNRIRALRSESLQIF